MLTVDSELQGVRFGEQNALPEGRGGGGALPVRGLLASKKVARLVWG